MVKHSSCILALLTSFSIAQPVEQRFEVASVKKHVYPVNVFGFGSGPASIRISGNRVSIPQVTFAGLILLAYDLQPYQLSPLPSGVADGDRYDVEAVAAGAGDFTEDQVRPMLRNLLADRFQLRVGESTKELPAYDLVIGKGGSKLKLSAFGTRPGVVTKQDAGGLLRAQFSHEPMEVLLGYLQVAVPDRLPVFDKSGLGDFYDFSLEFNRRADDAEDTSIFTAVQEQLGLKLQRTKATVRFLQIDHIEAPSSN